MVISLIRRVKILPRLASSAPFLCLIVAHLEWPDMGTSTASEFAVTLAAKGEYSTYAGGFLRLPDFPPADADREKVCGFPQENRIMSINVTNLDGKSGIEGEAGGKHKRRRAQEEPTKFP